MSARTAGSCGAISTIVFTIRQPLPARAELSVISPAKNPRITSRIGAGLSRTRLSCCRPWQKYRRSAVWKSALLSP
jgi:hypothetical protein